jgi:hypothetical protein
MTTEKVQVKEAVRRPLRSVTGLEKIEEDLAENQVVKLVEAIQQIQ